MTQSIQVQFQTLAECLQNQTCQILSLTGDLETKLHLVNLGFHTRSHIKLAMIRHNNYVVSVDGSRFVLDKSIAEHIRVQLLS